MERRGKRLFTCTLELKLHVDERLLEIQSHILAASAERQGNHNVTKPHKEILQQIFDMKQHFIHPK